MYRINSDRILSYHGISHRTTSSPILLLRIICVPSPLSGPVEAPGAAALIPSVGVGAAVDAGVGAAAAALVHVLAAAAALLEVKAGGTHTLKAAQCVVAGGGATH